MVSFSREVARSLRAEDGRHREHGGGSTAPRPTTTARSRSIGRRSSGAAVLSVTAALAASALAEVEPVWLEDDPAPGTSAAFQTFDRPALAPDGTVAFGGDLNGATDADDLVFGHGVVIAREGAAAPGTTGVFDRFEFFETAHQCTATGHVAFVADLRDVAPDAERAVYRNDTLIAWSGQLVPGLAGERYVDFGFVSVTDDGRVAFLAEFDGPSSTNTAIMFDGTVLYREGDPIPGMPEETWDGIFDDVHANARGDMLFEGNTSLPTASDRVLWRRLVTRDGVSESIVAQEGVPFEVRDGLDSLTLIQQAALAQNGAWALRGNLNLAATDADGVVLSADGVIAQEGDPVPELPGVQLGMINAVAINSVGDVVYLADLVGSTPPGVDEGLFVGSTLVLTDGSPAPGLPDGTLFSDIGFEDVVVNDAREVVFAASYSGAESGDGLFRLVLTTPCAPDLNDDGMVAEGDLFVLFLAWGACPPDAVCPEDLDGDGTIGFADLVTMLDAWGPCDA